MIKEKKCKGNGVTKGYGCNKLVPVSLYNKSNRIYGLGLSCGCYQKWLTTTDVGKVKMQKAILKATKPRKELEQAEQQRKLEKSLPIALKQTQIVFNEYIRLRDKGKPCISSGEPYRSDFDAGHLFSVKQYSGLRFNEDNVHGQSIGDNRFKYGNVEDYMLSVQDRIGKERFVKLQEQAKFYKVNPKKWTLDELKEIRKKYSKLIKELK